MTCRERQLSLVHIILFWQHKDVEGLPGWRISSMPEPPLRQYEHSKFFCSNFRTCAIHTLPDLNLPLICEFTCLTPPGPYKVTTCRKRELTLVLIILFWPHKDMEVLPGWGFNSIPGPSPKQHKHERRYTPSTHTFILTRWIWNDDYDGQMIFGDLGGLPDIFLTSEEKPLKKPHPGSLSRPGIEPGPTAWQAHMLPLAPQRWTHLNLISFIWFYCLL